MHDGGVRVVEVEELPIVAAVNKDARLGSKVKIETMDCMHLDCENYELCHNPAIQENKSYKILKILEPINCLDGRSLVKAELSDS